MHASTSIALATLETLAHVGDNLAIRNTFQVKINVPASLWKKREILSAANLHPTWVAEPPGSTTVGLGDAWIASESAALLLMPSVIIPEEYNVVLNPAHAASTQVGVKVIRQFVYDPSL